jgi:hypothetical protein
MNHRVGMAVVMLLGFLGCAHQQTRLQAPDEVEHDRDKEKETEVKTVGDFTTVGNAEPIPVSGVGLVVNLEGTGGDAPAGAYRTHLEDYLRKRGVTQIKEILASPDTSMVLVSALIPAGARKGDPLDVDVTLPPQSRTTSLRGGYLKECCLYDYDTTKHLSPQYAGGDRLLIGHVLAKAEGPLVVGMGDGEESAKLRVGKIWEGGRSKVDRPFYLIMNNDQQRVPVVQKIANRINDIFHGPNRGALADLAVPKTKTYLVLGVPQQYKLNLERFLRVVRQIPFEAAPAPGSPYLRRLEKDLLDPSRTVVAALRLEALGADGVPTLKLGLASPHPVVRFAAAEALAYLGSPASGEELALSVEKQPLVRAYGLTALASLDEAISHVKLRDLMAAPAPEIRYGAFRALRTLDEHDPAVQGELLNSSFWLHRVMPDAPPLVHLSTTRRAEVVLFGEDPTLVAPFAFVAGEFTFTAGRDDTQCTLSRLSVAHGRTHRQCSLKLEDVLRTLTDMGGTYAEVVELLRQAGKFQCLNCPVATDALPQALPVDELVKEAGRNPLLRGKDEPHRGDEVLPAPTLSEEGAGRH